MRKRFIVLYIAAGLLLSVLLVVIICNAKVEDAAAGKTFSKVEDLPYNKVGLVLGTGKTLEGGFINPYYQYRVNAAVELWKKNKIQSIIISGDNSTTDYNEPGDFRQDLIKLGVDSNQIYLEYAGFGLLIQW